jgi:arginine/lysine/ornithine decarboxylase
LLFLTDAQKDVPFIDALANAAKKVKTPFFFPGHQMGRGMPTILCQKLGIERSVFENDLPEDVEELDCLCSPEGPILAAQILAADLFGAAHTWFLCNGSTGGIMAAILAFVQLHRRNNQDMKRSTIILPRNCHKSAIQGAVISGAEVIYIDPVYDPILQVHHGCRLADIETVLKKVISPNTFRP